MENVRKKLLYFSYLDLDYFLNNLQYKSGLQLGSIESNFDQDRRTVG